MQRDREVRENSNTSGSTFDNFGGFGFRGSIFPSIFGRKDPFDDSVFSRPFGSLFRSKTFSSSSPGNLKQTDRSKGPVIEELDSDDEGVLDKEEGDDVNDAAWRNRNPFVQHPEDQTDDHGNSASDRKEISFSTNHDKVEPTRPQTRGVSFRRVTYGGINGAYYTATTSRRTGSDGVTFEESKQADRTTGEATHKISRGIHDKGHSVTRKLDSDGKVDMMQTLHNLNEDELAGFEQAWSSSADTHLPGWNRTFSFPGDSGAAGGTRHSQLAPWGGFLDPFKEHSDIIEGLRLDDSLRAQTSRGRPKKVVTINIE